MAFEFGPTLRAARIAKGLTIADISNTTHILEKTIEDLEHEVFKRIPAPIYGRGFVRRYAEVVGLDPAPLVKDFMDVYSGRREPTSSIEDESEAIATASANNTVEEEAGKAVAEESVEAADVTATQDEAPAVETQTVEEEVPPSVRSLPLFDKSVPADLAPSIPNIPPAAEESPYAYSYEEDQSSSSLRRFTNGLSNVSHGVIDTVSGLPSNTWRMCVVVGGMIVVIGLIGWGIARLYALTSSEGPATTDSAEMRAETKEIHREEAKPKSSAMSVQTAKPGKIKSTGEKIPSLYVD